MREQFLYVQRRLRSISPNFIRQSYRIIRSIGTQPTSPSIPEKLIETCQFCSSRNRLLDHLPKNAVVCEVGTYKGDFAREIVNRCQPKELHLIDIDYSHFNNENLENQKIKQHRGHSVEIINKFPDDHFDWIYIDADHSYESVLADAEASALKIKKNGYIVFNDFAHIDTELGRYGVHRAAIEFAIRHEWPMVFFAYNGTALYDVAFQKI